jgi:hypothetical protein
MSIPFVNKVTLRDTSPDSPALAYFNGLLYLGWKGDGNNGLNVMYSADNGKTFRDKYTSPETSTQAPALCVHDGNLYIAWTSTGKLPTINVALVAVEGNKITGFNNKVTLGDTSPFSPALASFNGRLYLGWRSDGNNGLNVMYSADNGKTFGNQYNSPETSTQAPALCVHNDNLYIAWKSDGNDYLNVATVAVDGNKITGFTNKVTLSDTSKFSPTIASVSTNRLYLGWTGVGNDQLNVMYSADNGKTFGDKYTSPETSTQAPALFHADDGNLYIAWTGVGNDQLNVAIVPIYIGNTQRTISVPETGYGSDINNCNFTAKLVLNYDGTCTFSGTYNNTGNMPIFTAYAQNYSVAIVINAGGIPYAFEHSGTAQNASSDSWNITTKSPAVEDNWEAVVVGQASCKSTNNAPPGGILNAIGSTLSQLFSDAEAVVGTVITIIGNATSTFSTGGASGGGIPSDGD